MDGWPVRAARYRRASRPFPSNLQSKLSNTDFIIELELELPRPSLCRPAGFAIGIGRKAGMRRWRWMETRGPKYGRNFRRPRNQRGLTSPWHSLPSGRCRFRPVIPSSDCCLRLGQGDSSPTTPVQRRLAIQVLGHVGIRRAIQFPPFPCRSSISHASRATEEESVIASRMWI